MRPDTSTLWRNSSLLPLPGSSPIAADPAPTSAAPQYAGLTSAVDIAARQRAANLASEEAARRSGLEGLTPRVAMQDVHEALVGLVGDVLDRRVPLAEACTKNDRLRGLGLVLLLACAAWIAVMY